jgi:hypothetical protein
VQTFDEKPRRRLFELLKSQGLAMNQKVVFLSDGGDDVRKVQQKRYCWRIQTRPPGNYFGLCDQPGAGFRYSGNRL